MNSLYVLPVTEIEIVKTISDSEDSAARWDKRKPRIIMGVKAFTKTTLSHVCKLSIKTDVFPWKLKIT